MSSKVVSTTIRKSVTLLIELCKIKAGKSSKNGEVKIMISASEVAECGTVRYNGPNIP